MVLHHTESLSLGTTFECPNHLAVVVEQLVRDLKQEYPDSDDIIVIVNTPYALHGLVAHIVTNQGTFPVRFDPVSPGYEYTHGEVHLMYGFSGGGWE